VPVEIRELVIRAVVQSGPAPADGDAAIAPAAAAAPAGAAPDALVQECVRQVLRILATDRER
jgi:hypothetical protein